MLHISSFLQRHVTATVHIISDLRIVRLTFVQLRRWCGYTGGAAPAAAAAVPLLRRLLAAAAAWLAAAWRRLLAAVAESAQRGARPLVWVRRPHGLLPVTRARGASSLIPFASSVSNYNARAPCLSAPTTTRPQTPIHIHLHIYTLRQDAYALITHTHTAKLLLEEICKETQIASNMNAHTKCERLHKSHHD